MISEKEAEILAFLHNRDVKNVLEIANETKTTYSHVHKTLKKFGDLKYLSCIKKKNSRFCEVKLLKKGVEVAELCNKLMVATK